VFKPALILKRCSERRAGAVATVYEQSVSVRAMGVRATVLEGKFRSEAARREFTDFGTAQTSL
jgi:hypothetical protein